MSVAPEYDQQTILVVDDEPITRMMMCELLQPFGFHTIEAANGGQALEVFESESPSLVLMDVQMPEMDGITACRRMRENSQHPHTPILLVTGREDYPTIEKAFNAGATDFITKPLNLQLLSQRVRYALRNQSLAHALSLNKMQLNRAQQVAHMGHWTLDISSMQFEVSSNLRALYGVKRSHDRYDYASFLGLYAEADSKALDQALQASIQDKRERNLELRLKPRHQNEYRYFSVHWQSISDESGIVSQLLGVSQDISTRKQSEAIIHHQTYFDQLTNLPNRRMFQQRLDQAMIQSCESEKSIAVFFVDCDRFKQINDTFGRELGDVLIRSIANRLSECVWNSDTVSRVSSDEFVLLLEGIRQKEDCVRIADRVLSVLSEPYKLNDHTLYARFSIGIALVSPCDQQAEDLLACADAAMAQAKQLGGNQFQFYNKELNENKRGSLALEQDLCQALERNQLELYYQPLNSVDSGEIIGAEALLRWNHPTRGMIPPGEFVNIAEESGLIIPIGQWVLDQACQCLKTWQQNGYKNFGLGVNLSPRQFMQPDLISSLSSIIKETGVNPNQLHLEITESCAMHDTSASIAKLRQLKELGLSIAIDDFGTGYSSLNYLQQMPIDTLKVDRCFVLNLVYSTRDQELIRAMITMAHSMGMKVVAEGVESEAHLDFLRNLQCEMAQGFLFSRPVPRADFEQLAFMPNGKKTGSKKCSGETEH